MPSDPVFAEPPPPAQRMNLVVDVESVDELSFWRRLSLMTQYALTPARLARRVAPLHAYSPADLCASDLKSIQINAYRYGPAAIVEGQSRTWEADYYTDVRGVIDELMRSGSSRNSWCNEDGSYVATTFPIIRGPEPKHELLLMDADTEGYLLDLIHTRENEYGDTYRVEPSRDTSIFAEAGGLALGTTTNVQLGPYQRVFRLPVEQYGQYRITASSPTNEVDPVLYLYVQPVSGDVPVVIQWNDDLDPSIRNRNARIETVLEPTSRYYIEVKEFFGESGVVEMRAELIPETAR